MKKFSKRYVSELQKVDQTRRYTVPEAVELVRTMGSAKFDQTVELCLLLGVDVKKADQMMRGTISLPKGIGKSRSVIVFAEGEDAEKAAAAGADEVGGDELVDKVAKGWTDFDVAIAVPAMMPKVGKLGRVLGPQGKMPSPKAGTVTADVATAVSEFKAGKIEYRCDAGGNLHVPVGKVSFPPEDLVTNVEAMIDHVRASRPTTVKGTFIIRGTLCATMSPGIQLSVA